MSTSNLDSTIKSQDIWNNYYTTIEEGAVGCLYPNEPLVRIVSTVRKGIKFNSEQFFSDQGKENSNRNNFSGECLEIGFGHVSNLLMMNEKGFNCTGLEVSMEAVKRGESRLKGFKNIKLQFWEDLGKLPFNDNQFDFIYGLECIYYNVDLCNIISEIRRCLKPNGYFAFSFFSNDHDYHKFIDVMSEEKLYNVVKWSDNHPSHRIRGAILSQPKSKEALIQLFENFGEKRIFTEESDFSPTFNSWWYIYGSNQK